MELFEALGYGVCHRDPARTMDGAWLCHRCTGLYLGALVGLGHGSGLARIAGTGAQLLLFAVLVLPIAVDGLVLGRGSVVDVPALRTASGALAGLGTGLLLGAIGGTAVRWPGALDRARAGWLVVWVWIIAGMGALLAGWPQVLDLAVAMGLLGLCVAGSAWVLGSAVRGVRRWRRGVPPAGAIRFGVLPLAALACAEIAVSCAVPPRFKPTTLWVFAALDWVRGMLGV